MCANYEFLFLKMLKIFVNEVFEKLLHIWYISNSVKSDYAPLHIMYRISRNFGGTNIWYFV